MKIRQREWEKTLKLVGKDTELVWKHTEFGVKRIPKIWRNFMPYKVFQTGQM